MTSLMIAGARLTYDGIKAKYAETTEGYKSKFSYKRGVVLVVTPGDKWIKFDELVNRVTEAWEEPRLEVIEELMHDLHFFANMQLMILARDEINLQSVIREIVERNHGGIKWHDLVKAITNRPNVMTPDNLDAAIKVTVENDPQTGLLNYGNQKRFVYSMSR